MIEMMVVVGIVAILAAVAAASLSRARPRATLASATAEVQAALHGARQSALANGEDVVVMILPVWAGHGPRLVVYRDGDFGLLTGGTPNFDDYAPGSLVHAARSEVLTTVDLPPEITIGPATGMGAAATLPAPYDAVTVTQACSFCKTSGDRRGAIRFDARGQATFYSQNATKRPSGVGQSFSITIDGTGVSTFLVTSASGSVRVIKGG